MNDFASRPGWMRAARHVTLAAATALIVLVVAIWSDATGDNIVRGREPGLAIVISLGTAFAGAVFLAWALLIGPYYAIRRRTIPLSSNLRRDVGIWAAINAGVHTVAWLQVVPGVSIAQFFLWPASAGATVPLRLDFFGITNHLGAVATVILLILLAISSNAALQRLGGRRWKSVQRWVYLGAGATALHGLFYQVMSQRSRGFMLLLAGLVVIVVTGQLWGWLRRRRAQ